MTEQIRVSSLAKDRINSALAAAERARSHAADIAGAIAAQCGIDLTVKDNGWSWEPETGAFVKPNDKLATIAEHLNGDSTSTADELVKEA